MGSSAPPQAKYMYMTIIFIQVYWYIYQISGERLQDHWFSGFWDISKATHADCTYIERHM